MTNRAPTTPTVEEQVLTQSRRRCALCYGLHKDLRIKKGQIAHINRNNADSKLANLAFLCLEHHEEYDSKSRQAKGITPAELRSYLDDLVTVIATEWSKPAPVTQPSPDPRDRLAGHYIVDGVNYQSEVEVQHLGDGIMRVSGLALWGTGSASTHTGSVDFVGDLRGNKVYFADKHGDKWYNLELALEPGRLTAIETGSTGYHGMNVSFNGQYKKL